MSEETANRIQWYRELIEVIERGDTDVAVIACECAIDQLEREAGEWPNELDG